MNIYPSEMKAAEKIILITFEVIVLIKHFI